jgi:hypothetical protein
MRCYFYPSNFIRFEGRGLGDRPVRGSALRPRKATRYPSSACVTFKMTVTIIPFMRMAFAASVCLLKQDAVRVLLSAEQKYQAGAWVGTQRGIYQDDEMNKSKEDTG